MGVIAEGIPRVCKDESSNPHVLGIPNSVFIKNSTLIRAAESETLNRMHPGLRRFDIKKMCYRQDFCMIQNALQERLSNKMRCRPGFLTKA